MSDQIIALFEHRRHTFLLGYLQYPNKHSDAHAYAIMHRIAPIFHENMQREIHGTDPFAELYYVNEDFISELLEYIDERWLEKDFSSLGFYKLEDRFGGYKVNRGKLLHALEYIRIDGRFDDSLWNAVQADAPAEGNRIRGTFSPAEVYFD